MRSGVIGLRFWMASLAVGVAFVGFWSWGLGKPVIDAIGIFALITALLYIERRSRKG